jgi:hypothetical protein
VRDHQAVYPVATQCRVDVAFAGVVFRGVALTIKGVVTGWAAGNLIRNETTREGGRMVLRESYDLAERELGYGTALGNSLRGSTVQGAFALGAGFGVNGWDWVPVVASVNAIKGAIARCSPVVKSLFK